MRKFIPINGLLYKDINTIKSKLLEQDLKLLSYDEKFDIFFNELKNN